MNVKGIKLCVEVVNVSITMEDFIVLVQRVSLKVFFCCEREFLPTI